LNRNHNPRLKQVFKGAALAALRHEAFKAYYQRLIDHGTRPELARVAVARKLAAIALPRPAAPRGVQRQESICSRLIPDRAVRSLITMLHRLRCESCLKPSASQVAGESQLDPQ
jgi:hypothetical protein